MFAFFVSALAQSQSDPKESAESLIISCIAFVYRVEQSFSAGFREKVLYALCPYTFCSLCGSRGGQTAKEDPSTKRRGLGG